MMTCRHAPQGVVAVDVGVNTNKCVIDFSPLEIAAKIALLSAQLQSPYEAFSTLQPE